MTTTKESYRYNLLRGTYRGGYVPAREHLDLTCISIMKPPSCFTVVWTLR